MKREWLGILFLAVGCGHTLPIPAADVPKLAEYHKVGVVTVKDGERTVRVGKRDEPKLNVQLDRDCSFWTTVFNKDACDTRVTTALDNLRFDGETLTFRKELQGIFTSETREVKAKPSEVLSASLSLGNYTPTSWQPTLGFGLGVLGPSQAISLNIQYFPTDWLALEAGMFPAAHVGTFYTGFRLRSWVVMPIRPFVGAFANLAVATANPNVDEFPEEQEGSSSTVVGGRIGVDWEFGQRRWLLTAEFNVGLTLSDDDSKWLGAGKKGQWNPWGGGTISYLW
jgi:hypothetical protein